MTAVAISPMSLPVLIFFLLLDAILAGGVFQLRFENEIKGSNKLLFGLLIVVLIQIGIFILGLSLNQAVFAGFVLIPSLISLAIVLSPWPERKPDMDLGEPGRIDERTIMFSRAELVPGTERYRKYYEDHPDHLEADLLFRNAPGLLSPDSRLYHPFLFPAADSSFFTVESLHSKTDGTVAEVPSQYRPEKLWPFIRQWALEMGCHSIGVCALKPAHLYSVGGRKHNYDEAVVNRHSHAIAFTVEMKEDRVASAPKASIIMESSQQYLQAGMIAVQLAAFLRNQGFPARAHIDGKYQVRCPQVARDAGLGEIGRMGLLMTPKLGPRVRIGVVTTLAELPISGCKPEPSMIRFCQICKKCAESCPSQAIPDDDRKISNHSLGWTINQEKCYQYWCQIGTDCGRCMAVCPYSHPNNRFHNAIRFFIRHAPLFRKIAFHLDTWIYGRKPLPHELPDWMNPKN